MTEICEAYSRGGVDAATPHGVLVVQFVQSKTGPGSCKPLVSLGS